MRVIALFVVFFLVGTAEASLIGNPSDPAILEEGFWISDRCFSSVRAGVMGDFLIQKRLKSCRESKKLHIGRSEMNSTQALADVGYNIREWFDLHFLGGVATRVQYHWHQSGINYQANGNQGLYWGGSAKLILLEIHDTTLGFDFHGGGIEKIKGPLLQNASVAETNFSSRLYFWQCALGISQHIQSLRPYIGIVSHQFTSTIDRKSMKRVRFHDLVQVGMYEGCSVSVGSRIFLNLEARQFYEMGLSISGEFRF